MIHGTEDEVIDFSHGLAIYEKCPRAVDPLWVEVREFIGNFWNYPKDKNYENVSAVFYTCKIFLGSWS